MIIYKQLKLDVTILNTNTICPNIHGTHVTTNNSTNNNVEFFFVSDFKIVYNKNY